jgi:hypothetical protein
MERAGVEVKLSVKIHPHMLRHACGLALANKGHDTRLAGLSRPSQHSADREIHGAIADAVQGLLEEVS